MSKLMSKKINSTEVVLDKNMFQTGSRGRLLAIMLPMLSTNMSKSWQSQLPTDKKGGNYEKAELPEPSGNQPE